MAAGVIRYQHVGPIVPDDVPTILAQTGERRDEAVVAAPARRCLLAAQPALADFVLPPAHWANRQLPDPRQEARPTALMEELRCLVCQGQSIADSAMPRWPATCAPWSASGSRAGESPRRSAPG